MNRIILLDSRPLGLLAHSNPNAEALRCEAWSQSLIAQGDRLLVPEIADYEVRRELLRAGKTDSIRILDTLREGLGFVPLTSEAMLKAAEFWAVLRQQRMQTAPDLALDADVILAAQCATLRPEQWEMAGAGVVIATGNVGHLGRVVSAHEWQTV